MNTSRVTSIIPFLASSTNGRSRAIQLSTPLSARRTGAIFHPFRPGSEQARKFGLARDLEEKLGTVFAYNFHNDVWRFAVLNFLLSCLLLSLRNLCTQMFDLG